MKLHIKITRDESAQLLRLKDVPKQLLAPLARAWNQASQEVLGQAVKKRFTGRGPFPVSQNRLGIRTNRLRKSLRATLVQADANGNIRSTMGSNVAYFGPHEFGFRGRVQVAGHTRKVGGRAKPQQVSRRVARDTTAPLRYRLERGKPSIIYVRPHSRNLNIPARRPLGTQIDDIQTRLTFRQKIRAALNLILRKQP